MKLHHGGRLRAASERYGIALADWLDFSTAINPQMWPVPEFPASVWQRLPEDDDALCNAATSYYFALREELRAACDAVSNALPVPGTQAVIETLPRLFFLPRRVWVPAIGYQEHAYCWQKHGHTLLRYNRLPTVDQLQTHDVVVVINPNNPTAECHPPATLRRLAADLERQQGLLVVDEAFMDCTPERSLLTSSLPTNAVVMRSFGKFFGLAGIRLGFCFATPDLLQRLDEALGPWAVNHPARYLAQHALVDTEWHTLTRQRLLAASKRIQQSLQEILTGVVFSATGLFVTLSLGRGTAESLYDFLACHGILVRLYSDEGLIRIGVDADEASIQRLIDAISLWQTKA